MRTPLEILARALLEIADCPGHGVPRRDPCEHERAAMQALTDAEIAARTMKIEVDACLKQLRAIEERTV